METSKHEKSEESRSSSDGEKPANVSSRMWEKFQLLKEKRQNISRKSRERKMKALKQQKDDRKEEEKKRNEKDEKAPESEDTDKVKVYTAANETVETRNETTSESQRNWDEIREFLDCNSHLSADHSKPAPKSGLEKGIDDAVERGDFSTAEKLSDQLATREFGSKISAAIDARNFAAKRKREEEEKKTKKKKKLHWGFEHKEKWEMKANM